MFRTLPRLLAGSAAALAALAGTISPASATAPSAVTVRPHLGNLIVAAGGEGSGGVVFGSVDRPAGATRPVNIHQVRVTVDTAGLAGVATVAPERDDFLSRCSTAGTIISCTSVDPFTFGDDEPLLMPLALLTVTAPADAEAGSSGTLVVTAQADGGPVSSSTSTVRIGEGVDLAAGKLRRITAAPGTRTATDLRVANAGRRPVEGAVLVMIGWPAELLDGPGFRNCRYGMMLTCTFTDVLAPGRTYVLSDPVRLHIPADAAAGSSSSAFGMWFTTTEWQELVHSIPVDGDPVPGRPGTGGPTRLKAQVARESLPQVDIRPENNVVITETVVGGRRQTDLTAVGATVRGSVGDRVRATVGFANTGPGTLYPGLFDNADPGTYVAVPPGLTAVTVDDRCATLPDAGPPYEDSFSPLDLADDPAALVHRPGAPAYVCAAPTGSTAPGGRTLFDFTFQVRKPSEAAGKIIINDGDLLGGERIDRDTRNDRAVVAVTVDGGAADGVTDDGGTGGGLPVTGTDTTTVTAVGTLLLVAGVGAWLLVRRRRIRFTT